MATAQSMPVLTLRLATRDYQGIRIAIDGDFLTVFHKQSEKWIEEINTLSKDDVEFMGGPPEDVGRRLRFPKSMFWICVEVIAAHLPDASRADYIRSFRCETTPIAFVELEFSDKANPAGWNELIDEVSERHRHMWSDIW